MKAGWVYIMTDAPCVTADIAARVWQHKNGLGSKFCKQYGLDRLVHAEQAPSIVEAFAREKAMKAWKRAWKIRLIEQSNPNWEELFERINM